MALQFRTLDFRSIDGSNNNRADPALNQANTDFVRVGPANFADGFNEMTTGPNPRTISNIVVAQEDAGSRGHEASLADDWPGNR
jgi:peroxidase